MSKLVLLLFISYLCLLQAQENRRTCEKLTRVCERNQDTVGRDDIITIHVNADCRRRDRRWIDITRCQLERAACELSLVKCAESTCDNIVKALGRRNY